MSLVKSENTHADDQGMLKNSAETQVEVMYVTDELTGSHYSARVQPS